MANAQHTPQDNYNLQAIIDGYTIIAYGAQQGLGLAEGFYAAIMLQFIHAFLSRKNQAFAVLDAGCGVGRFIFDLAQFFPQAKFMGVDFSPLMVERATDMLLNGSTVTITRKSRSFSFQGRKFTNVALQHADAQCLPFANQSFDCINATNLLDRVPDAAVVIRELLRVLKPGGTLLLSTPLNFDGFEPAKLYSIPEILELLEANGLRIDSCMDDVPYHEYRDDRNTGYWRGLLVSGVKRSPALEFCDPMRVSLRAQATTYKAVFEGAPWHESWPIPEAEASLRQLQSYPSTAGEILVNLRGQDVVGFWYGHLLSEQVKFDQIARLVDNRAPLFYLAEFGIHPLWQGQGYGKQMMQRIAQKHSSFVTRTINPAMLQLLQDNFSVSVLAQDFIDLEHPDRQWYWCQNLD